jgi:hypothetical protein
MRFLALQKRSSRFIDVRFQPFLLQNPHGYCVEVVEIVPDKAAHPTIHP